MYEAIEKNSKKAEKILKPKTAIIIVMWKWGHLIKKISKIKKIKSQIS